MTKRNETKEDEPHNEPEIRLEEDSFFNVAKIFYFLAPILGLMIGVIYLQSGENIPTSESQDRIYQEYNLTDAEIIKILEYKLRKGDNIVNDWFIRKITTEVEKELQKKN